MRTPPELNALLMEQISFMQSSCDSFDAGAAGEAKRLAVSIRTLVHQTQQSHGLLSQLGLLDMKFFDTCTPSFANSLVPCSGLIVIAMYGGNVFVVPHLDDTGEISYVSFKEWWNRIVIVDGQRASFSREDLVLDAANQDGGAHVDPALDGAYASLALNNSMGWTCTASGKNEVPPTGGHLVSIRQIAHEVLRSLVPGYGKRQCLPANATAIHSTAFGPQMAAEASRPVKTGRYAPCHCGSGKKFRQCHGAPI